MEEIKNKLRQRPIESDTTIRKQCFVDFGEHTALYENWKWDGINASSLVFLAKDIEGKDKEEFITDCLKKMELDVDQQTTNSINGEYFFINFAFTVD